MDDDLKNRIRQRAYKFIGDYPTTGFARKMGCILFVLDILEPFSQEFRTIRTRLNQLDITGRKESLVEQDYFRKFIRSTRLKYVPVDQVHPGDILLLNEYSSNGRIDHLGLYLGDGEYIHLKRSRTFFDFGEKVFLENNMHKIKGVVRGKIDG
jgi:hypothetical protein